MAQKIVQHPSGKPPESPHPETVQEVVERRLGHRPPEPKQYGPYEPDPKYALSFMEVSRLQEAWFALEALGALFEKDEEKAGVFELLKFIWTPLADISGRLDEIQHDQEPDQEGGGDE